MKLPNEYQNWEICKTLVLHINPWFAQFYPETPSMLEPVQFSCSFVSDSLWPHELQHARPLCPSPTPGVHPNPCPLSRWCHQTISSSVVPFSSCPQSFPASGSFPVSWLFASGGQKVLELQLQHQSFQWIFRLGFLQDWLVWSPLLSKGLARVFSSTTVLKHQFLSAHTLWSNSHIHTRLLEKPYLSLYRPLSAKGYLCFLICYLGLS